MLTAALLHFLVRRVLTARPAKLIELQPARRGLLILGGGVIAILAITALQRNNLAGHLLIPFVYLSAWGFEALSESKLGYQQL